MKDAIDKIIRWYKHDIPLDSIRQKLTGSKISGLAICDIYAVLYSYHKTSKVEQRRSNLITELTLDRFYWIWQQWKMGVEEQTILDKIANAKNCSLSATKALLYSFKRRCKSTKIIATATRDQDSLKLLRKGHWITLNGKVYLAIPAELFLEGDNRLLTDLDAIENIQKTNNTNQPATATKPTGIDQPPPYRPDPAISIANNGAVEFGDVDLTDKLSKNQDTLPSQEQPQEFDPKTWQEAQEEFMQELDEQGVPDVPQVLNEKKAEEEAGKGIPVEQLQSKLSDLLG